MSLAQVLHLAKDLILHTPTISIPTLSLTGFTFFTLVTYTHSQLHTNAQMGFVNSCESIADSRARGELAFRESIPAVDDDQLVSCEAI